MPFATIDDYENWIARLNGFGPYLDQTIDLMREGMRRGLVQAADRHGAGAGADCPAGRRGSGGQSVLRSVREAAGVDTGR